MGLFVSAVATATDVCDFEQASVGKLNLKNWHTTNIDPGAIVVDSKNAFHKNVLKMSPSMRYLTVFNSFKSVNSGALEVDFDFKTNSYKIAPRIAIALHNTNLKRLPYQSVVWLGLGYKSKLYYFSNGWKALDNFTLNKWHHLKIIVHITGTEAGTFDVNLDGGNFEGTGLKWRNKLLISPEKPLSKLFFQIMPKTSSKGEKYLMIDNIRVSGVNENEVPAVKTKPSADTGRIIEDSFKSEVLGAQKHFTVILPAGFKSASQKKYPVLYMFHGRGRNERSLVDNPKTCAILMKAKFITILPDGDDNWYVNSPVDDKSRYNDYIEEMMTYVENKYPISKDRRHRALSGWSMGGYGCTMFAETHPKRFSALAPIIALLDYPRHGLPKGRSYGIQIKRFGDDPEVWKKFNPITNASALKNMRIFIITAKKCFTLIMNRNFVSQLKSLNIPLKYEEINGSHSFSTLTAALPSVVNFMNKTIVSE
jgi:enterochelin esterase-like enzyme